MNKHYIQSLKLFLLLVLALSSGCGPVTAIPSPTLTPGPSQTSEYYSIVTQQPGSECLPPLTNFAFPAGLVKDLGNVTPHPPTLPPTNNWKVKTRLPDGFDYGIGDITILANGDLWIKGYFQWETAYSIYKSGKEPTIYLAEAFNEAYRYYIPDKILQTKDGTLWGIGTDYGGGLHPWEYWHTKPLISRFNEVTGKFEYIENTLHDNDAYAGIRDTKLDVNGLIWILVKQRDDDNALPAGLYQFNPNTLKTTYFLEMPDDITYLSIMPVSDGSIWLLGDRFAPEPKTVLSRYYPETGELQPYQGTFSIIENVDFQNSNVPASSPLFLDSNDRLWFGNEGWLDHPASERPSWYRIIQSPIFIDGQVLGKPAAFTRSEPFGMFESSDGMFWFWAWIGTVRLNPKIGEWCLFTTYSSPVVEDSNHTLWMVADNKLYKYELGQ